MGKGHKRWKHVVGKPAKTVRVLDMEELAFQDERGQLTCSLYPRIPAALS